MKQGRCARPTSLFIGRAGDSSQVQSRPHPVTTEARSDWSHPTSTRSKLRVRHTTDYDRDPDGCGSVSNNRLTAGIRSGKSAAAASRA